MSDDLLPQDTNIWTTSSELVARTNRREPRVINTWVTTLYHNGREVMSGEGHVIKDELPMLAARYNKNNTSLQQHRKSGADLPEVSRRSACNKDKITPSLPGLEPVNA
ncbi:MAG: hypothetical protein V4662_13770 [Verrucomicrobiota bacterium]